MSVEAEGRTVHWGKAERWFAAGVASLISILIAVLIAILSYFGSEMTQKQDKQGDDIQSVKIQQAVQGGTLTTLTTQLADVPRLTRDMAEVKVRVERLEQDTRDNNRRQP